MRRASAARLLRASVVLPLLAVPYAGCGSESAPAGATSSGATTTTTTSSTSSGTGGAGGEGGGSGGAGGGTAPGCAPFSEGPYGTASREIADDFTLPTLDGDLRFADVWTGCDSFVFLNYAEGYDYAEQLWTSSTTKLLDTSPTNAHFVFMSFAEDDAQATADVQAMKDKVDASLGGMTDDERAAWEGRFHYVTKGAFGLDNWISEMLMAKGVFSFAIDRFQRVREVGLLFNVASGSAAKAKVEYAAQEVIRFNVEWDREEALAAEPSPTILPVLTAEKAQFDVDVTFPDAATMATFDTMELDLALYCDAHLDENCGEWDYIANLTLCDVDDPTVCTTELGRWITTYGREGRWVTDVSPMLALLRDGGVRRLHLNPANAYVVDLSIRLFDAGKGSHPDEAVYLFSGGAFGAAYNDAYAPLTVDVPADVTKVELAAVITGHGWGVEADNCAEFCDHDHHFGVNGVDFVKAHPEAGTSRGCQDQVGAGVIPNQFGTWVLGRGGWCPGLDVKPWVVDVTDAVVIGGSNTITYQGLFEGETYVPKPGDPNSGGFGANINMTSWLVLYR
jgi:hypothetical protein